MAEIILDEKNFKSEVMESKSPDLVDFWAPWCGPCKMMTPVIEELAKEFEGKAKLCKLNVDENPGPAGDYSVMSIPTLIFFKGGKAVERLVGAQSKVLLAEKLNKLL